MFSAKIKNDFEELFDWRDKIKKKTTIEELKNILIKNLNEHKEFFKNFKTSFNMEANIINCFSEYQNKLFWNIEPIKLYFNYDKLKEYYNQIDRIINLKKSKISQQDFIMKFHSYAYDENCTEIFNMLKSK